jgi:hypothetical protein
MVDKAKHSLIVTHKYVSKKSEQKAWDNYVARCKKNEEIDKQVRESGDVEAIILNVRSRLGRKRGPKYNDGL